MFENATEFPPAFTDIDEGMAHLDELRSAELAKMEAEAKELMAQDSEDPREHSYFMRLDRKTIVKTETEYVRLQLEGVAMKIVPYSTALQLLKEEDARKRQRVKAKQAKKRAKASRKRNRR